MTTSRTTGSKAVTLEEFLAYVNLPEHRDQDFELINGEIIEVSPARTSHSYLENLIVVAIHLYCRAHNLPVYTTSGDGSYLIDGRVIAPDVAYKRTPMSDDYPDPVPPLLAVEIISPTEESTPIRNKRRVYQEAGILYWELYPQEKSIDIYEPGQPPRTIERDGSLDGGQVIPGFTLPLSELFA